ncbi:undecaprenyl-phosphate glucose phosphotransferase [Anaeromicropila herbilytica]|uniref:Undecaprenyl-phosphate glucose phosphotransferase n=1 Tax=Anaeromicropila herbilytica TaxID=2785025 RepID=A0A7R7EJA1_9FIRM|nr:undecaprenyl-phosphate glucose phosphotransferase [Anaeromicropila herbilytica]BCN29790.1 undecaprenyl-phosphate glucose phosphotransferase [Anaeromicropila herbilytica]
MIKNNQQTFNRIHVLLDAFIIILSYYISYKLRFEFLPAHFDFFLLETAYHYPVDIYARQLFYIIPGYIVIYYLGHLYDPKRSKGKRVELWNLLKANTIGIIYYIIVLYVFIKDIHFSRKFILVFFVVTVLLEYIFRLALAASLQHLRRKGFNMKHILVVGYSQAAESYIDRIVNNPQWGYLIHGILDDTKKKHLAYKGVHVIGTVDELKYFLATNDLDEIAITLSIDEYSKLESIVSICEKSGVHTKFVPDYHNIIPTNPYTEDLNGLPVINIRNVPLSNSFNKFIKRVIDIFGAIVALIIFSIPMIIVTIIIKLTSEGPIIFSQNRVGLHNREFKMYKFRSMAVQTETKERKAWTTINDPRVTKIGSIIRKTSIDELPQLFNVLKGDMSLIGPRPERPFFVEKFKEEIPRYMIKHQVRPGLTGWAQVNGYRGDTSIRKRIDHDLYYIENWTLGLDFKILVMTFFKGFVNKNAY